MKKTMYHFWNSKTKRYLGTCNSGGEDGYYTHQAAEIEVPEFPEPLTDTEKLEKLLALAKLFRKQGEETGTFTAYCDTRSALDALIKEYSK